MMEIGYMTPPFGFNLFYLKSVAPPEVTMSDIYWSVIPYVLVTLVGVLILIIFPASRCTSRTCSSDRRGRRPGSFARRQQDDRSNR